MLFCQLGHAKRWREICVGLEASDGKLGHLGLPRAPARSTLAYANEHRPWQMYETVFHQLLEKFGRTKAAVKPHRLPDHKVHWPAFGVVTEGKEHEFQVAREMNFTPGQPWRSIAATPIINGS